MLMMQNVMKVTILILSETVIQMSLTLAKKNMTIQSKLQVWNMIESIYTRKVGLIGTKLPN